MPDINKKIKKLHNRVEEKLKAMNTNVIYRDDVLRAVWDSLIELRTEGVDLHLWDLHDETFTIPATPCEVTIRFEV